MSNENQKILRESLDAVKRRDYVSEKEIRDYLRSGGLRARLRGDTNV